jgi:hypothetical protein
MEEKIETRVPPERIWQAWEKAHANQGGGAIASGCVGKSKVKNGQGKKGQAFKYEVFDVVKGERFSLIWKTLFVRLIFTHSVLPKKRGSEIKYSVQIRGLFAIPVRWLLGNKIRYNISQVLKTMVKRLEMEV